MEEINTKELTEQDVQVLKLICKKVWAECDNQYGYITEKHNVIDNMQDMPENATYLLGMFDLLNTEKAFIETLRAFQQEDTVVSQELLRFVGDTYSELSLRWANLIDKMTNDK